jgi:ankyrin repeat protein
VFCQLEVLRNCLPQNVRRVLQDLPASLDGTYERMLRDILKANPDQAYRLLQCLTVATRPLFVDELAEILALDFSGAKDGVPTLNKDWRWDDERQGVLATCSSLIVVVDGGFFDYNTWRKRRVVQFAHFSVKEFLTSHRLADIKADISFFHIRLEPAHTVIAQACLAILLQSDHDDGTKSTSPLSQYAALHWVGHARFWNVSLRLEDGMQRLFDPAKPYFTAWLNSYDLDYTWKSFLRDDNDSISSYNLESNFTSFGEDDAPLCLYYAVLCGFHNLTKYLITKYPQHVNATVGLKKSPLAAALHNRHLQVAELLHQYGAVGPIGYNGRTLLHAASADGLVDVTQWLLNTGADANVQERNHRTPLNYAAANGRLEIVRVLLGHGVDVNAADNGTSLHEATSGGHVDVVRLLIEHGADVHARDQSQSTPLHLASSKGNAGTARLLIEHRADVHARDQSQSTPLHLASSKWNAETAWLLIEHGADVDARDQSQSTPLHLALSCGNTVTARLLIEHGADVHARDQSQSTPLHMASLLPSWCDAEDTVRLLIEHGASVSAYDKNHQTPLHRVSSSRRPNTDSLRLLLENGADMDVEDYDGLTPFQIASSKGHDEIAQLLLDHPASIVSNTL